MIPRCFPGAAPMLAAPMLAVVIAFAGLAYGQTKEPAETEPFFHSDDVVALIGGEEAVVQRDEPELELLVRRQPGLSGVKFRNLAFEGDTVFVQFRDLNFPSWEAQMKQVGATVIVAQFGRMESLAGPEGIPDFVDAYARLLAPLADDGRRVLLLAASPPRGADRSHVDSYNAATRELASRRHWKFLDPAAPSLEKAAIATLGFSPQPKASPELVRLVRRKNMLWFHYWRPQNWAFLHGDRTKQASSRDHRDPSIRWFPEEMNRWLPLVAAKENEIEQTLNADRQP